MFHVTGASIRARGYGAPPIPPVPYWLSPPVAVPPPPPPSVSWAPPPHAARIAARLGTAMPVAPARRRNSRRLSARRWVGSCVMVSPRSRTAPRSGEHRNANHEDAHPAVGAPPEDAPSGFASRQRPDELR